MTQRNRLPERGRVDRSRTLRFQFNGRTYTGHPGDTVASALLANGVRLVGRSFKYGRPRGVIAAGPEEPNAILQVGTDPATTTPNLRATQTELYDGLVCSSTNGWPSTERDLTSVVGKVGGRMMPPGFYYKTFMWPSSLWMTYEKGIRKAAGLGQSPSQPDPAEYDHMNHHVDVLVVGAGPAGLSAARTAARAGARVMIADEQPELGGHLLASRATISGTPAAKWVRRQTDALAREPEVTVLRRTTAVGYHDHNFVVLSERRTDHLGPDAGGVRERLHRVRAGQVVIATGAHERPLVFGNNDRPGVMTASAVGTYINRYGVVPGERLVLMTTNDHAYHTALDWHNAGREVVAVVDTRAEAGGDLPTEARACGIRVLTGHGVIEAAGGRSVTGARVAPLSADGESLAGTTHELPCDVIATSGGWSPVVHLTCHTGDKPVWSEEVLGFVPGETRQARVCAGGVNGTYALEAVIHEGVDAGKRAATAWGFEATEMRDLAVSVAEPSQDPSMKLFLVPHHKPVTRAPKQFVDFQTDVTAAAIEVAVREGYESIEHVKRYTVMGFGTDQGKLGNVNGVALTARARGKTIPETGTTVFRPAYTPVTFGALAGMERGGLLDPARFTPMHLWHVRQGAAFEDVGQWKRPWYYPRHGESMQQAVNRECLAVRQRVGMLDASTLGKIDIQGSDAREFLNRVYTNAWMKLQPGRCRYGLMLKEDGMVFDDGVTACVDDEHFIMTTTTGNAGPVLEWLERWHQTEWPELDVCFTSITDQWATVTVTGPESRNVVAKLCDDIDFSREAFPFMAWREGTVAGALARVFRISFTGELTYEINVPADYGMHLWEAVYAAGEPYGITPYGTETMHVLRAEKGFIIVGQDTDGSVTPEDLGMHWALKREKPFSFLGQRSLDRSDSRRRDREQFVGIRPLNGEAVLPEGAQAVENPSNPVPKRTIGHVTSSYYSAALGHSIALGLIERGHDRQRERLHFMTSDGRLEEAELCSTVFYDPDGARQNV
ncbi:sarcosine oxidase subunit alpha family protein [Aquisalimonas lutea]|uniref:sarcosine oxidase subunit alpha family protein n=1 Tax=Aquisalimonas lutea TaxID=1327750 RepID=UPI0025B5936B|nr:sarcosine oxidase subunit alpha family protein [Aquisalimonas lutea]MDN3519863.1 sarcosine oxidase subunit alpha family protein [Aquisalimonas lutea]